MIPSQFPSHLINCYAAESIYTLSGLLIVLTGDGTGVLIPYWFVRQSSTVFVKRPVFR